MRIIMPMIHLHLDPLGGLAGDMFAACLLGAFPQHRDAVEAAVSCAAPVRCRLLAHDDGVLTGWRFQIEGADGRSAAATDDAEPRHAEHDHGHDHHHEHTLDPHPDDTASGVEHGHRAWRDIRTHLGDCGLEDVVHAHAIGIFTTLAEAEGQVHGCQPDAITFHEVGAADSIGDIVAAAVLIDRIGAVGWSVSALPLGSGRIRTAHGLMPVPAPATTLLLQGFETIDDGIGGERVTPTGAAILAYLRRAGLLGSRPAGRLVGTGIGHGMRRLPGTSNCVRVLVLEPQVREDNGGQGAAHRELEVISFEVDDQSGEDLATGLDRVRTLPGVHDIVQMTAFGKKNRLAVHVQVLVAPERAAEVVAACFRETTTIGLRTHRVQGRALQWQMARLEVDGVPVDVKLAQRPDGQTAKAESDHLLASDGHAGRARLRRLAEAIALGAGA